MTNLKDPGTRQVLEGYLPAAFFFCPRLVAEFFPFAALPPGFLLHSGGSSSPGMGGFPFPARSRIRRVSAAIGAAPPFPKIFLGAQGRNLFRHRHVDELV